MIEFDEDFDVDPAEGLQSVQNGQDVQEAPKTPPSDSFYGRLVNSDVIQWLAPFLGRSGWRLRVDGKLEASPQMLWKTPWLYTIPAPRINCMLWSLVMFKGIAMRSGKPWVPSGCQLCFKVVVRPHTLKQAFALYDLQRDLNRPAKVGMELRKYVFGNWGGYFYNRGLDEGLERYEEVRAAVDAHPELGPDVPVILKRGCTEMEMACGPSDEWEVSQRQVEMEILINQNVVIDVQNVYIPDVITNHIKRTMIEHACNVGDASYLEYTDGVKLNPSYVTYHEAVESADD